MRLATFSITDPWLILGTEMIYANQISYDIIVLHLNFQVYLSTHNFF